MSLTSWLYANDPDLSALHVANVTFWRAVGPFPTIGHRGIAR